MYRFTPIQFESMGMTDSGIPLMKARKGGEHKPYDERTVNFYRDEPGDYADIQLRLKYY